MISGRAMRRSTAMTSTAVSSRLARVREMLSPHLPTSGGDSESSEYAVRWFSVTAENSTIIYAHTRTRALFYNPMLYRSTNSIFSARCNIYISRLCYDVSVDLSVRLSVTEVHWRIIANLGFKFRSHFTAHCGRRAARRAACVRIILRHASQC